MDDYLKPYKAFSNLQTNTKLFCYLGNTLSIFMFFFFFFHLITQKSSFYIHLFNVQAMMYCLNNILIEVSFTIGSKRCLELILTSNIHLQLTTFWFGSKVVKFQVWIFPFISIFHLLH